MAIIALLVAILLPSLAQARKTSRMVVCLSHLKEMGNGVAMYAIDYKDSLPGPLHPTMFQNVSYPPPPLPQIDQIKHLPTMLRKYFSESQRGTGEIAADISTCPSHPTPRGEFVSYGGAPRAFHYAINTWTYTEPYFYFGFTVHGQTYEAWKNDEKDRDGPDSRAPKRISQIKNVTREWIIADAFQKPPESMLSKRPELRTLPHGSWPDAAVTVSGEPLPKSPFHLGSGYARRGTTYGYLGKANTLYLDMHAESQNGWRGTVNPADND